MQEKQIPFSNSALRRRALWSAVVVAVLCVFVTLFLLYAPFPPALRRFLLIAIWIALPALWLVSALLDDVRQHKTKYILTENAIIMDKKGWFGTHTKKMYRYDSIESVQSNSRAKGKFGSLEIIFSDQSSLVLAGIEKPDTYAREIKNRAADTRSSVRVDTSR